MNDRWVSLIVRFIVNGALPALAIVWWWPMGLTGVLTLLLGFVLLACFFSFEDGYAAGRARRR